MKYSCKKATGSSTCDVILGFMSPWNLSIVTSFVDEPKAKNVATKNDYESKIL